VHSGLITKFFETTKIAPHKMVVFQRDYTLPPATRCAYPQHPPALSTSRRADALPPTGSVHLSGQGRPGYNRWKRITGAQSTRCGHRHRIARCGGGYGPRRSGAAVSKGPHTQRFLCTVLSLSAAVLFCVLCQGSVL